MWIIRVWVCVCVCARAAASADGAGDALRCAAPRCARAVAELDGAGDALRCAAPRCARAVAELDGAGDALRCAAPRCARVGGGVSDNEYLVDGNQINIDYVDGKYLLVECNEGHELESDALPQFRRALRVPAVTLARCAPPASGSLARRLAALNATLAQTASQGNLTLTSLPPQPPLAARHFAGLERLVSLRVSGAGAGRPALAAGFLGPLRALRSLALQSVRLAPAELDAAPASLRQLSLRDTGVGRLADAVLASDLRELVVVDATLADFSVPASLRTLSLSLRNTSLRVESLPALETLMLTAWAEARPAALARCGALRSLRLSRAALAALPARWVAACPRLERLALDRAARLRSLPPALLEGAHALLHLALIRGALETLPEGLLDDVPNLRTLDLTDNRLRTLPSATFLGPVALQSLRLASNALDGDVARALAALHALQELSLAFNPRLGDLCDDGSFGYSRLNNLKKLTYLSLNKTNITRICRDWRDNLTLLKTLDLQHTNISELWYDDLQYRRADSVADADVLLQGAPVASVRYSERDYDAAASAPASGATVHLSEPLDCDCDMYWTRLALERPGRGVRVLGLRCAAGRALSDVSVDDMLCPAPAACLAAALPAACECAARPTRGPAGARRLVVARCGGAALRRVPPLRATAAVHYDLLLARNNISELRATDLSPGADAADPPPHLRVLDLRNNSLSVVDEEAAKALGRRALRVLLAGNPLACDCRAAPLLRALSVRDLAAAACADGRALAAVRAEHCGARVPPAAWAAAALAALLAATALVAAYFAPPERRVVLKVLLLRWGLLRRDAAREREDDGRPFDAFVSFSHEDEEVVRELAARLEGGAAPLRLCLHYRDWVPGRLIPEQIVESVRESRRTVVLVSRHFLASTWARAEFREAHAHALRDATPRLVAVLLEEPAALPLDAALRRYLAGNTYVRWGDPWFWDKLRLALPPPRAPPPGAAPHAPPPGVAPHAPPPGAAPHAPGKGESRPL